jgi:ADP-heptose:LPS heptosyltransferase
MKNQTIRRITGALERANKALWYTFVFPLVFPRRQDVPSLSDVQRLLVIRSDAIGDMILTTPVFRALKAHNPSLRLWVAASDRNANVIAADPDVERAIILTKRGKIQWDAVRTLRSFAPQVILNCVTNSTTKYGVLAKLIARDSYTVALRHHDRPEYARLFSRLIDVPDMYSRAYADIMLEFVRQTFGITTAINDSLPHIAIENKYVVEAENFLRSVNIVPHTPLFVNLSAGQPRKRWSEEKYIALITMLRTQFDAIILTAAPEDRDKAERILQKFDANVCLFRAENLRALAALATQCAMVITPDTSLVHVAAAVKVPVVAWYSAKESVLSQWLPYGIPYRAVYTDEYDVTAVSPEEVYKNINELFSAATL